MCCILAKWFPESGWVICKARDRNYTPKIEFNRYNDSDTGIERLLFEDTITGYAEGINSAGVCILSASLQVANDEKEVTKTTRKKTLDGDKIKQALLSSTARAAVAQALEEKLTGSTLIADRKSCFLIEACNRNGEYHKAVTELETDQVVARTNHGVALPWAGYQRNVDRKQELSRISSESRQAIGKFIVDTARSPDDLIDGLAKIWIDNPQLNVMRTDTETKKMRTTAQLMCIPGENTLFVRPVASDINYDFWKLNRAGAETWVELLSNRELYRNAKPQSTPPFADITAHHEVD